MEYYFKVKTNNNIYDNTATLVKAKDVIEAGRKVENMLGIEEMTRWGVKIVEITRTDITKVIG